MDNGEPLLDPKREPWKHLKASTLKASSADYKEEVNRRWISFVSKKTGTSTATNRVPRPRNWKMEELFEW
jgi:hypothetical protein